MPPLLRVGKKPPRVGGFRPQVQNLINKGTLKYKPLANLGYKPPGAGKKNPYGIPKLPPGLGQSILGDIKAWAPGWEAHLAGQGQGQQQPSYEGLIGGDWEVQQAITDMGARMGQMRGDFQSGLRQALIDLGITDASKLGGLGQYIDADTIKKAAENKYSATAQIAAQEKKSLAQSNAALAARGILSSGQTTKSAGDIASQAESGRFSALREFLSGGQAGLRGLADTEYQMAQGIAQARAAAASRAASTYGLGMGEAGAPYSAPFAAPTAVTKKPVTPKTVKKVTVKKPPPRPNRPLYESGRRKGKR